MNAQITSISSTVKEFCQLKKDMEAYAENQDRYAKDFMFIDELYRLILDRPAEHPIRILERDKKLFESLNQVHSSNFLLLYLDWISYFSFEWLIHVRVSN